MKAKRPRTGRRRTSTSFDGTRWPQSPTGSREAIDLSLPNDGGVRDRFTQEIKVTVRNLRSRTFVTAGVPVVPPQLPNRAAIPNAPPGIYVSSRTLRRGDTYTVYVYTPKPTKRELRAAGTFYDRDLDTSRAIELAEGRRQRSSGTPPGTPAAFVKFPEWDLRNSAPEAFAVRLPAPRGEAADARARAGRPRTSPDLGAGPAAHAGRATPARLREAVQACLAPGFRYTEPPPAESRTLDGFLFDASSGYCQQFSGAMALLLRMGGIPARVATGFTPATTTRPGSTSCATSTPTPGSRCGSPTYGWVSLDPTPATAPPRSQSSDRGTPAIGDAPDLGGAGGIDPRTGLAAQDSTPWELYAGLGVLAALLLGGGVFAFLHPVAGAPAPLPELERALRRTRRPAGPGGDAAGARGVVRPLARRRGLRPRPARPSATAAATSRRRAPSAAGCAVSWDVAEGCSGGCARGGRSRRGVTRARKIGGHG